jgi:predicted AlkP superfamily phosphohydrolase/phosphomutase
MSRVLVVGLDALSPDLVEQWLPDLPHLGQVMHNGIYGPLQSIMQPVTPVAWPAMISGRDPSHLGYTDFVYRKGQSYTDLHLVHSRLIQVPTLFTLLPEAGRRAHAVSVPVSYPPISIKNGVCVSCFMAPSANRPITAPAELQQELLRQTSEPFILDAFVPEQAREVDRDALLRQIREMDRQRFDLARHLITSTEWDLLFMVAMGTDRIGHYFMRYHDPLHGRYDPDPRYRSAIYDHYRFCDQQLGELIALAGPDTVVMVVSDHGIQRTDGRVNLNDWLIAQGYLRLREPVDKPTPLAKAPIDWQHTRAWAQGYGGQIYLNLRGREPQGVVAPDEADGLLGELEAKLQTLTTASGKPLPATTIRRQQIYAGPQAGRCPDLFVQFDELRHLTADAVGHQALVNPIAELGNDDASHANAGFLAMAGPGVPRQGRFAALSLLDVAPTILHLLDLPVPSDLEGRPIHVDEDPVYSDEDEAELTNRLRALYLD